MCLSFAIINMDSVCKWDNLSRQDFNYCCKGDKKYGNMMLKICSDIVGLIDITLWGNWNWCNVWHITWFEELLGEYLCVSTQEIYVLICALGIIVIYIHQIHHIIVYLIFLSERFKNLEEWSWSFKLCWVSPNFIWWI